jgi:hypothetical protein
MRPPEPSSGERAREVNGVIEVRVRALEQLFNSMDPSPFHEKELDPDAVDYIVGSAKELPDQSPAVLRVYVDQSTALPEEDRILEEAVRAHFARQSQHSRRELRELLRRGWTSLVIGLAFLGASVVAGEFIMRQMAERPLATVLRESLLIGGWVAMWRPMEIFLHDWWVIRDERRIYDRLGQMAVRIVHRVQSSSR